MTRPDTQPEKGDTPRVSELEALRASEEYGFRKLNEATAALATANARIAELEARLSRCEGCGANEMESCRRLSDKACFREFHGGDRTARPLTKSSDTQEECVFGEADCGPVVMSDDSGEPWCGKCREMRRAEIAEARIGELERERDEARAQAEGSAAGTRNDGLREAAEIAQQRADVDKRLSASGQVDKAEALLCILTAIGVRDAIRARLTPKNP